VQRSIFASVGLALLFCDCIICTTGEGSGQVAIVAMEMTKNQQILNTFYDGFGGLG
jgi:hypothetical protein